MAFVCGGFASSGGDFYHTCDAVLSDEEQRREQAYERHTKAHGAYDNGYLSKLWLKGCEI